MKPTLFHVLVREISRSRWKLCRLSRFRFRFASLIRLPSTTFAIRLGPFFGRAAAVLLLSALVDIRFFRTKFIRRAFQVVRIDLAAKLTPFYAHDFFPRQPDGYRLYWNNRATV
jgi:hypothetical protein